ncbi:MAG: tol-pal system protein YbgF [Betaproteobacteria bacterium]|nr:tol-pal system protein YbgF [Betaproteobacteria bacterium]
MRKALLALLLAGAWSTGHAGLFDDEEARKRIAEQQAQIGQLQTQNQALLDRVAKLEDALKNQGLLDLLNRIEALTAEISRLRGEIEVVQNGVATGEKRQKDFYVDLDTRLRRLEQPGAPAPGAAAPAPPAAAQPANPGPASAVPSVPAPAKAAVASAPPASPAVDPGSEGRAYEAAYNQFKIGNYQGAIAGFQSFLAGHASSVLAPNAQYWIGNAYFNLRDYKSAIASQQKLIAAYPDSSKVPDALLNIASSQQELNDLANAKKTLENLVAKYPVSDAAEKARRRLAALK